MGSERRTLRLVVLAAALLAVAVVPAAAEGPADFFKGKTIRIVVGFGVGGGYDLYARLLARHLSRHIPGEPKVVVENLEGAGSVRAANYVYEAAPRDGTVIAAVNQNAPMYQLLGGEGARFRVADVSWLGSLTHSNEVLYTWHTSGITSLDQAKAREVVLGAVAVTSDSYIYPTVINGLLGTRFRIVNGYATGQALNLAVERGEVMGRGGTSWASITSSRPTWMAEKAINILVQVGLQKRAEDLLRTCHARRPDRQRRRPSSRRRDLAAARARLRLLAAAGRAGRARRCATRRIRGDRH